MSDWDSLEEDNDNVISLDDLENMENQLESDEDSCLNDDDWSDSFDDLDSEEWEKQYHIEDEIPEKDPWELE